MQYATTVFMPCDGADAHGTDAQQGSMGTDNPTKTTDVTIQLVSPLNSTQTLLTFAI